MSGWIETLPSGRLRAVYRDADGQRHTELFDQRRQAKAFLAATAAEQARGRWVDPRGGQVLFRDRAETWFTSRVMRRATARAYGRTLRVHLVPTFGARQLKEITPLAVRAFVSELSGRRSPKTVRNAHALLSNVLRDAVLEGLLLTNPCLGVRLPQDRPYEAVFLSPPQIDRLVAAVPDHVRSLVQVAAGTGMRWGEITGLERQRVDLLRRRLEVVETLEDIDGALTFGQPNSARSHRTISLPPHHLAATAPGRSPGAALRGAGARAGLHQRARHCRAPQQLLLAHLGPGHQGRRTVPSAAVPRPAAQSRGAAHRRGRADEGDPGPARHASIVMTMDRYGHLLEDVDDQVLDAIERRLG